MSNYSEKVHALAAAWGWLTPPEDVLANAEMSLRWAGMRSGEILVELGLMTSARVEELLASKPEKSKSLEWLAQSEPRVRTQIERILTLKKALPFYDSLSGLTEHPAGKDEEVARRSNEIDAALMVIEMRDPVLVFSSWDALFAFMTAGPESRVRDPIRRAVQGANLKLAVSRREEVAIVIGASGYATSGDGGNDTEAIWQGASSETPEQKELSRLIDEALTLNATDISIKPFRDGSAQVLMRRYGDLVVPRGRAKLDPELAASAVKFLATKSGANPSNTRMTSPSDGQITYRSTAGDVFLRLSFIPLMHPGERRDLISVSARLLPRVEKSISVDDLKINEPVRVQLDLAMQMGAGFILVAGPTNSGKSTTVAGAVGLHVARYGDTRKRISVEDPIERFIYGMTQVNVRTKSNARNAGTGEDERFAPILRAIKRHDPDVISVGEIRDEATANLCVSSATSGHLVLSTIHANDAIMAADVLARMVDKSLSFQLMESLALILSQRLVKTLCTCKKMRATTDEDRRVWKHYCDVTGDFGELPDQLAKPEGCSKRECQDGYSGSVPINEVLPFTRRAKDLAARLLSDPSARTELAQLRTVTLVGEGLRLLQAGATDLESVLV